MLSRKAVDAIEDSMTDFLGADVWRVLRNKMDKSRGVRLENILEHSTAVKFAQELNDILPPAAPFVLDKISARLTHEFPRIGDAEQLSNFLHVVSEIRNCYDGAHVLSGLENRQHVALVYRSENDFSKILSSFRAAGIKKNRLNVFVCPEELQERAMTMMGTDLAAQQRDLVILDCNGLDVGGARMKESMISITKSTYRKAVREGKSGLNILGLCASHLLAHENEVDCMALEDAWEDIISMTDLPVSTICPYMWDARIPESRLEQNHNHGVRYL
ncbi:MAG: MEDS domain-containing protein [Nitrososphaera sp.]